MRVNTVFNSFTEKSSSQKSETKELLANVRYLSAEKLHQSANAAGVDKSASLNEAGNAANAACVTGELMYPQNDNTSRTCFATPCMLLSSLHLGTHVLPWVFG